MEDIRNGLEISRVVAATVANFYFIGASFMTVKTRKRNVNLFRWIVITMLLTVVIEMTVTMVKLDKLPKIQPLTANLLYMYSFCMQIHNLFPATLNENDQVCPAWHAFLGSWAAAALFELLVVAELAVEPRSSTFDLALGAAGTGLRCCLLVCLVAVYFWPDRGGYMRLEDLERGNGAMEGDGATGGAGANGKQNKPPSSSPGLNKSIAEAIKAAGGHVRWAFSFRILLPFILPSSFYSWEMLYTLASLFLMLTQTGLSLYTPRLFGAFSESVVEAYALRESSPIWRPFGLLTILELANSASGLPSLQQTLWQRFTTEREERAGSRIHAYLMHHEAAFFAGTDTTDVIMSVHLGNQVCQVLDFLVMQLVPQILTLMGAAASVFSLYGTHVGLVQGSVFALNSLILIRESQTVFPILDKQLMARGRLERRRRDAVAGWSTVTLYGQAEYESQTFSDGLRVQTDLKRKFELLEIGFGFVSNLVVTGGNYTATVLVILRGLQTNGSVGAVMAFASFWTMLQAPLQFLTGMPQRLLRDFYTIDRLRRLMSFERTMVYGTESLHQPAGDIELKNVSFSYHGDEGEKSVFKDLNLTIKGGETTAIVGPSGSGKSTLFQLIRRMYDVSEGTVKVGGQDIKTLNDGEMSQHVSMMTQFPDLFCDTMKENIRYGLQNATDGEIVAAAKEAGIHDVIESLPGKYETVQGSKEGTLSGGEKQRLAIARAYLHRDHVSVMLFDEATSALDPDNEARFKERTSLPGKTTIIIAQGLPSHYSPPSFRLFFW
ncbi:hypothetical protein PG985_004836 [Apiospora marii]|uniref:uncharacterized protein n=1 Tax=Apiospora marii TaxID=335849 RepID=UPI0031311BF6